MELSNYCKMMIRMIEFQSWLDEREKISLVFVLCDDACAAQCILTKNLVSHQQPDQILPDLLKHFAESREQDIESKIVDSLLLIKNYKLLSLLGYSEIDKLKEMKRSKKKYCLNIVRKVLFKICESISDQDLGQLIALIENDFIQQSSYFTNYGPDKMELNLLSYICQGYISDGIMSSKCDVSNLVRLLKKINQHGLAEKLKATEQKANESLVTLCKDNDSMENTLDIRGMREVKNIISSDEFYPMDRDRMGLCLIVNQRNGSVLFGDIRHGTNHDRDMLKITFISLGYKVFIFENLGSVEMKKSIRGMIKGKVVSSHSSLVLCVLSHGKRGTIQCVDGVGVSVDDIENWILGGECPQLLKKPKILLIQACQGNDFQRALPYLRNEEDSAMLECDGPSDDCVPPTADLLTFYASVPGYVSIRHPHLGSIFIQTLCLELLKRGHTDHFGDIVTHVNDRLSEKQFDYDYKVSMPQVKHTNRKKLYFPPSQHHRLKAAKLLFKKYFIEELISECIFKVAAFRRFNFQRQNPLV